MTAGGNGSLELWKYSYPTQRKIKEKDGHDKGVLGQVQLLQLGEVAQLSWDAGGEGVNVQAQRCHLGEAAQLSWDA